MIERIDGENRSDWSSSLYHILCGTARCDTETYVDNNCQSQLNSFILHGLMHHVSAQQQVIIKLIKKLLCKLYNIILRHSYMWLRSQSHVYTATRDQLA